MKAVRPMDHVPMGSVEVTPVQTEVRFGCKPCRSRVSSLALGFYSARFRK